ncbi:MAG: hypothetical protein LBE31_03205, partial [Deltaproteobacteria bacterium]|nr:hypothetical protein [Deltaproteobacteria bacterium]
MPPVLEDISNVSKRLTIVIPAEDIDDFVSEIYEDLLKKTRVKGFRSGKAPKAMLMKMHIDLVKRNLLEKLISPKIIDSLVELNIEPATTPTLETIPEIKDGEPMTITTTFEIYPEFEVPDFSSITLTKPPILVTDEMVDKELDRLRYRMAIVSAAEPDHTIVSGDEVTIEMLVPKDDQYVSLKEYDRPAKPIIKNDKNKKHKRPPRPEADTKSPLLKVIAGLTNSESPELSQSVLHHTPGDVYDLPFT